MRHTGERGKLSDLFGRGMIYVGVWSMQLVVAVLVSPVLAHTIEPQEFGSLAAAIALYQLLMLLSVFGLDQALEMRRVEERDPAAPVSRGLLAAAMLLAWATMGLVALALPVWAPAFGFDPASPLVVITLLWTAPGAAVLMVLAILQAEDRLGPFALVSAFSTAGGLIFGLILMFTLERTAVVYAWGGVIGQGLALLIGLGLTRPRWRGAWQPTELRAALALGIPLVLSGLSQFVLTAADRFLVQRWLGTVEVARYQVAFTVGNVINLLLLFVNRAWLPRLKAIGDSSERWVAIVAARDGIYRLLAWALLGVTVSAPILLRIVAPESYRLEPLVIVVFIVALGALPLTSITASTQILITEATSRPLAVAALAAVVVKTAVTLLGLAWLGLPGAALGTTLAVLAQAGVLRWIVANRHRGGSGSAATLGLLAATMAAAAGSTVLPQGGGWFWGRLAVSVLCLVPFAFAWRQLVTSPSEA